MYSPIEEIKTEVVKSGQKRQIKTPGVNRCNHSTAGELDEWQGRARQGKV